jgi:adenosylcobinamide-phosphate synthase
LVDIISGYILDLIAGDPYWFPHPVRIIGKLIQVLEKLLRKIFRGEKGERFGGAVLAAAVVTLTYAGTWGLLRLLNANPVIYHLANVLLIYFTLATKSLGEEANKVYKELKSGDIKGAREALSGIVGRDTDKLEQNGIIRAAVETVAENTSDGIVAPLFYVFIGGAPMAMAYKAVNTLDSMVGYKNKRYMNFGWASARLDDIANCIPARIAALLLAAASFIYLGDYKRSFAMVIRDGRNHSSPNSGFPEAAVAGSLGIQLGGTNYYFGRRVDKPTIGDMKRDCSIEDIRDTIILMYIASILALLVFSGIAWIKTTF